MNWYEDIITWIFCLNKNVSSESKYGQSFKWLDIQTWTSHLLLLLLTSYTNIHSILLCFLFLHQYMNWFIESICQLRWVCHQITQFAHSCLYEYADSPPAHYYYQDNLTFVWNANWILNKVYMLSWFSPCVSEIIMSFFSVSIFFLISFWRIVLPRIKSWRRSRIIS